MEMIFVLLFLGLTCGVCVRLFAASYMARVHAREDSHIQELITSAGEILEGTDGTVQNFLALMPDGVADQDSICYYFDKHCVLFANRLGRTLFRVWASAA